MPYALLFLWTTKDTFIKSVPLAHVHIMAVNSDHCQAF